VPDEKIFLRKLRKEHNGHQGVFPEEGEGTLIEKSASQ
jgi:hypothetical protein